MLWAVCFFFLPVYGEAETRGVRVLGVALLGSDFKVLRAIHGGQIRQKSGPAQEERYRPRETGEDEDDADVRCLSPSGRVNSLRQLRAERAHRGDLIESFGEVARTANKALICANADLRSTFKLKIVENRTGVDSHRREKRESGAQHAAFEGRRKNKVGENQTNGVPEYVRWNETLEVDVPISWVAIWQWQCCYLAHSLIALVRGLHKS
ncbi:hypothetical protein C8R43DRAFT_960129 [Mycena crocata]|nr:hypothetical protein C8R43DRAFT_960129 [Mycena crocata]